MSHPALRDLRHKIRQNTLRDEASAIGALTKSADLTISERMEIAKKGAGLVAKVRSTMKPSLMEAFLAEYGLSTNEGLALMCLAEALLRVPDSYTIDTLIEDKILGGGWSEHAGQSISRLVNVSTMGLRVTNAVLDDGVDGAVATLRGAVKRLGMPVIRTAVKQVMKELGRQFVLGQDMSDALNRAAKREKVGYTYSYDMLGEAAHTAKDAEEYFDAYVRSIEALSRRARGDVRTNPGISIKLSALHPRYEQVNQARVMEELSPRVLHLAKMAADANMGLNIDAEEADRLDISLSVIEEVLSDKSLMGWDGFGVVVQAYGKRAPFVLDWLYTLATTLDRKIMVRLVKGAYWDAEIKRAQVTGLQDFPVFTKKEHSDISYISCAAKLFRMTDRIYPQFATHNAHTVAAVLHYAADAPKDSFEFQRLHGMGESLHEVMRKEEGTNCRIYAPVGVHRDLLAYLVRRLLENGANSSFVNQIVDTAISPAEVAADPIDAAQKSGPSKIKLPKDIMGEGRRNSCGWDITDPIELATIDHGRGAFKDHKWSANPLVGFERTTKENVIDITNPANPSEVVGSVELADGDDVESAYEAAKAAQLNWQKLSMNTRAQALDDAAEAMEENAFELFALLCREAGKSLPDGISEVREAVDFLRYYAAEARRRDGCAAKARGVFVCISPWNFPLAIFTGQVAAALVTGNAVLAKPAEQTPLIAYRAIELMHAAGIPEAVAQLLPGDGPTVGAALTALKGLDGVCFTGSTETAQIINRSMAEHAAPKAPLVAETGGLNAMIVDSTALPEQAVQDIVDSAFQSAGQRCSALRMLYLQADIKDRFLTMLYGAMDELEISNPWSVTSDVGPVIDVEAQDNITAYVEEMEYKGKLLKKLVAPKDGRYVAPHVFEVSGIEEMEREIFGPILHVATYEAEELPQVIRTINSRGYGLTMGLHTRIEERVEQVKSLAKVGNLYINRNQIGAVVGCQPFGGEGLSGTGPKAGGPDYLDVFMTADVNVGDAFSEVDAAKLTDIISAQQDWESFVATLRTEFTEQQDIIDLTDSLLQEHSHFIQDMPSPVGELNQLTSHARGHIVCMGPSFTGLIAQVMQAYFMGNEITVSNAETNFSTYDAVAYSEDSNASLGIKKQLASDDGVIKPLIADVLAPYRYKLERHCCTDTTAAGGDAALIAGVI